MEMTSTTCSSRLVFSVLLLFFFPSSHYEHIYFSQRGLNHHIPLQLKMYCYAVTKLVQIHCHTPDTSPKRGWFSLGVTHVEKDPVYVAVFGICQYKILNPFDIRAKNQRFPKLNGFSRGRVNDEEILINTSPLLNIFIPYLPN